MKIYCAGPLFNNKEKEEMQEIAISLERSGYEVFLPQRDGLEFANLFSVYNEMGFSEGDTNLLLSKAIFTLDVFQVLDSHGLVLNINGRVPDEGAMVEAGIAWNAGKKIVIYKNDARTLINGNDNPLLLGLANFITIDSVSKIPEAFNALFVDCDLSGKEPIDTSHLKALYEQGAQIAHVARSMKDKNVICNKLLEILGRSAYV
jgi:nucleoside 2-deoxyribosyltransferase